PFPYTTLFRSHALAHGGAQTVHSRGAGGSTTAEQQPVVRSKAVIVDQIIHVTHGRAGRDQLPGQLSQRAGGPDVTADRDETPVQPRQESIAVGIGSNDQLIRPHLAVVGTDCYTGRILPDGADPGVTMDMRTGLLCRTGQSQDIFERMKAATAGIQHSTVVVSVQQPAQPAAIMEAQLVIPKPLQLRVPALQRG